MIVEESFHIINSSWNTFSKLGRNLLNGGCVATSFVCVMYFVWWSHVGLVMLRGGNTFTLISLG